MHPHLLEREARFEDRALALACASHSGEPGHVALAADVLGRARLGAGALECGCHWPFDRDVALAMARGGEAPTPLHNNCSGKHAGFLCTAVHLGEGIAGYVEPGHPVQARVRGVIEDLTGTVLGPDRRGIDGCSIPTHHGVASGLTPSPAPGWRPRARGPGGG